MKDRKVIKLGLSFVLNIKIIEMLGQLVGLSMVFIIFGQR